MDHDARSSSGDADEPPQKRQRVLACRRCRGRKQKCENQRPCTNCVRSGDECIPMDPAPRPHVDAEYVRALEERIADLEARSPRQSQDHLQSSSADAFNGARPVTRDSHSNGHGHDVNASQPGRRLANAPNANSRFHTLVEAAHMPDTAMDAVRSASTSSVSPANPSGQRHSYSSRQSPGASAVTAMAFEDDNASDSGLDHLLLGVVTSPSIRDDGSNPFVHSLAASIQPSRPPQDEIAAAQSLVALVPPEVDDLLLGAYRDRAQAQYPFFYWNAVLTWVSEWKKCPPTELASRAWQGFFTNLIYATGLLLLSLPRVGQSDARSFYRSGLSLLPHVLRRKNDTLHAQAYLLLCINSMHRSSTQRVLSLSSTALRFCVQQQLHLAETEPEPTTPAARLEIQVRRRCFWSAYGIDRLMMASYELPPLISDPFITTRLYANIDDDDLEAMAARTPPHEELPDAPVYTCVSPALCNLQCRRIQSEIMGYTLRWDYRDNYEDSPEWRIRILDALQTYKSRVQNFSDPEAKGHTSQRWVAIIYHYTLLLLYRPTKANVLGAAGDWAIQASSQACLIFRRGQMDRQIAQGWLGFVVQFQSGITLLYCFWATPPEYRTANYDSPDVSDALRACSNILAILADRWPKGECLRDVFELLAREVPLMDRPSRPPTRVSDSSADAIRKMLTKVRCLIVHRSIMRMIEEMISDDFPRLHNRPSPMAAAATAAAGPPSRPSQAGTPSGGLQFVNTPMGTTMFGLPFTTPLYGADGGSAPGADTAPGPGAEAQAGQNAAGAGAPLTAEELIAFPGMFDLDGWT